MFATYVVVQVFAFLDRASELLKVTTLATMLACRVFPGKCMSSKDDTFYGHAVAVFGKIRLDWFTPSTP